MNYEIEDRSKFFIRDSGNASMVLFKEKHDQFMLNNTGVVMFNLLLDNEKTEDVISELQKRYKTVDKSVLENDMQDIIRMLKMYGILKLDEEKTEKLNSTDIKAVDENDYDKVGRFIEDNRSEKHLVAGGKGYYTAVNIRAHVMNSQEYYYTKVDSDGNIEGAIVVVPNVSSSSVVNITALVVSRLVSKSRAAEIERELLDYVYASMINTVNKFRISYFAINENVPFLSEFRALGFTKEAELKKEFGNKSMFLYSLAL
jgi:hypothetical protein